MIVQLAALGVNALLDYLLIFGNFGFPGLGIAGAACATVAASAVSTAAFFVLFLLRRNRTEWGSWKSRHMDTGLLKRLIRFGFPSGARFMVEMFAWTVFVIFIGRIGSNELAVTNISWRINGIAFFPIIGLSQAVAILVGHAQGARQPDIAKRVVWRGMLVSQAWMVIMAAVFLLLPVTLLDLFNSHNGSAAYEGLLTTGVVLLRFVAVYCLLDACNYIFVSALTAAGDTRWTLLATLVLNAVFVAALFAADIWHRTLYAEWVIATAFVMAQALVWMGRFLQGRWKSFEVVEQKVVE
jgi:MATE family multidrug resistance protein